MGRLTTCFLMDCARRVGPNACVAVSRPYEEWSGDSVCSFFTTDRREVWDNLVDARDYARKYGTREDGYKADQLLKMYQRRMFPEGELG